MEPSGARQLNGEAFTRRAARGRWQIHGLLGTGWRDVIEQFLREIAVRIDQANAMPLQNELEDEVAQEGGLAGAGLADDVGVESSIGHVEPERHFAAPDLALADVKVMIVHAAQASRRSLIDEPDERTRRVVGASLARTLSNAPFERALWVISDWLRRLNDGGSIA
jgi:hypothetical protein